MSSWKRLEECPVCGGSRCVETLWIVYCYRWTKGFNKRQLSKTGLGIPKDLVLRRGLEGQSPSSDQSHEQKLRLEGLESTSPYDYGL